MQAPERERLRRKLEELAKKKKKIHTLIFLKGSTHLRQVSKLNFEEKSLILMKRNAGKLSTFATNVNSVIPFVHILRVRSMSFS